MGVCSDIACLKCKILMRLDKPLVYNGFSIGNKAFYGFIGNHLYENGCELFCYSDCDITPVDPPWYNYKTNEFSYLDDWQIIGHYSVDYEPFVYFAQSIASPQSIRLENPADHFVELDKNQLEDLTDAVDLFLDTASLKTPYLWAKNTY